MQNVPELLSPAGSAEALHSALIAGADAVYFGLNEGFNARAKSANFSLASLPQTVADIHNCGARAYVTLNTLIFEEEVPRIREILQQVDAAKVDAIIVQDLGLAALAHRLCPDLHLHASTQMTISCSYAMDFARHMGITRVVLPRELSLEHIKHIIQSSPLEVEVFILGALCMSYSGQCLASLAWGGRSANRGQCAQACRLPYQAVIDGQRRFPENHPAHLLSPRDQAGLTEIADLAQIGVNSLKIEGRLKGPHYVYMATQAVRHQLDSLPQNDAQAPTNVSSDAERLAQLRRDFTDLSLTYSRDFGHGFLRGIDHKNLVSQRTPQHHGVYLGTIAAKHGRTLTISRRQTTSNNQEPGEQRQQVLPVTPQKGMGAMIIPSRSQVTFQNTAPGLGGPIFDVQKTSNSWKLTFGHIGPNLDNVDVGDAVYLTSAPTLNSRIDQALKGQIIGRIPLHLKVSGHLGQPLTIQAHTTDLHTEIASIEMLQLAQRQSLSYQTLCDSLGAWGGTPYHLESLDCDNLDEGLFLPSSQLKPLRRELLRQLQSLKQCYKAELPKPYRAFASGYAGALQQKLPHLSALCRTAEQVETALRCGLSEIELEYYPQNPEYIKMVQMVRQQPQTSLTLCTPRLFHDGEERWLERLVQEECQTIMVRNLGALTYLRRSVDATKLDGDFSLNVTNSLTARYLLRCGLNRLVSSDDLDLKHLCQLAATLRKYDLTGNKFTPSPEPNHNSAISSPPSEHLSQRLVVPLYRHIPAFHTQHCFFAQHLSTEEHPRPGTCGCPCHKHTLALQDRLGEIHQVQTDLTCRNTIYDGRPKNLINQLPTYWRYDLRQFRLEFLLEKASEVRTIIDRCQQELDKLSN